jgi:hypothetical protein
MKKIILIFILLVNILVSISTAGEVSRPPTVKELEFSFWKIKSDIGEIEILLLPMNEHRNPAATG